MDRRWKEGTKKMKIITHLTSAHGRYDTRIFVKECKSLSSEYKVNLIVADGLGDEVIDNVNIFDVGKNKNRFFRLMVTRRLVFEKALSLQSDIIHIHDPELIPIAIKLKSKTNKIIYDVHEDMPRQILGKPYIPFLIRPLLSYFFEKYEDYRSKQFDLIVAATNAIQKRFMKLHNNVICVNNFPVLEELLTYSEWTNREQKVCYVGGIAYSRGIFEILEAVSKLSSTVSLDLAGTFSNDELKSKCEKLPGWLNVTYRGHVGREGVKEILSTSKIGLVTLHPLVNYVEAMPVKMFEYMAAGIPVIASNFPLWKDIVETNNCGVCVDPLNSDEIAAALNRIFSDEAIAKSMGMNGQKAVLDKYNWKNEEVILKLAYQALLC